MSITITNVLLKKNGDYIVNDKYLVHKQGNWQDKLVGLTAWLKSNTPTLEMSVVDMRLRKIGKIKKMGHRLMSETDWYVTRKAETETAIPANIIAYRKAIRDTIINEETFINAQEDTRIIGSRETEWPIKEANR